jgi:integrase
VDLRDVLADEAREAAKAKREAEAAEAAKLAKQRATLGLLLDAYVDGLERAGKASAPSVRRCLHRNIRDAMPSLWATPAANVTTDDLLDAVARLADADKLREAGKLRAYLRAAYAVAVQARRNAKAAPVLRALRLAHNPAADLATVEGSTNARNRALSESELQAYWRRIESLPDPDGALLRFHLLTGAQRVEQLARLTADDLRDGHVIRLRDGKGRRKQARNHDLPLLPDAVAALRSMKGGEAGPFLFSATCGFTPATYAVVQNRVRAVAEAMQEAGELQGEAFTPGDLRRTVETRLAAAGIEPWIRAQLQSHGISGVQAKHYDRHDYLRKRGLRWKPCIGS